MFNRFNMFRKIVLLLSGAVCVSFSPVSPVFAADSYTELLESARSLRLSAAALVDSVTAALDARDAARSAATVAAAAKVAVKDSAAVAESAVVDTAAAKVAVRDSAAVIDSTAADTAAAKAVVKDSSAVDDLALPQGFPSRIRPPVGTAAADSAVVDSAAVAAPRVKRAEPPARAPRIHPVSKPEIEMVLVKGGKFKMGCPGESGECMGDERPRHEVKLGNFYIAKYPVTQKQWASVMGINPSHFEGDDWADMPVEQVSWDEVQEFIKRLNVMTGKKYRLPTEAEWEYAAQGGVSGSGAKFFGHRFLDDIAWYDYNSYGKPQPVGGKQPNELGLHDMIGNVWEWVSDWYDKNYYRESHVSKPKGPLRGTERVYRGADFNSAESHCRNTIRNYNKPGYRAINLGFRLARSH